MGADIALRGDYYGKMDGNGISLSEDVTALLSSSAGIIVAVKDGSTTSIITGSAQGRMRKICKYPFR